MEYKIGTTLNLDPIKDRDIINKIGQLREQRLLSAYITSLFRHSDELLPEEDNIEVEADPIPATILEIKSQVNGMMKAIEDLNILAKSGKLLGFSGMTEETALGVYYIQKQVQKIESILGLGTKYTLFENNKLKDLNELSMRALDLIMDVLPKVLGSMQLNVGNSTQIEITKDNNKNEITSDINAIEKKKSMEDNEEPTEEDIDLFFKVAGE